MEMSARSARSKKFAKPLMLNACSQSFRRLLCVARTRVVCRDGLDPAIASYHADFMHLDPELWIAATASGSRILSSFGPILYANDNSDRHLSLGYRIEGGGRVT